MARIIAGEKGEEGGTTLAKRTITTLLGAALALLVAAPAEATLVYVKDAGDAETRVWVARDDGTQPRKVGLGHSPRISDDGRWIAWIQPGTPDQLMMRLADRSRKARVVARSSFIGEFQFSPDSKSLGLVLSRRLFVYDIREREEDRVASGVIRGFSFSPDSALDRVRDRRPQRRRRRAVRPLLGRGSRTPRGAGSRATASRSTRCGAPTGIIHDRMQRARRATRRPTTCSRSSPTAAACAGSRGCGSRR